jgi:uncharacterized protein (DUF2384 family)
MPKSAAIANSRSDFLNVMQLIDKSASRLRIMHRRKTQDKLDEVYAFLSDDDNVIQLSHITYPAIAYKEVKRVMGVSIKEYERIFAHTWRGITQKQDDDSVDKSYSERLLSILRIYAHGIAVFGDPDKLNAWLSSFSPVLATEPRQLLDTILGCGKVSDELGRIEHGSLA